MANLKEIKRKIKSVKGTAKTTKAMKLVSTAKLKKAETAAKKSKDYAIKFDEFLSRITSRILKYKTAGIESRYFREVENPSTVDIIFITADKGLCGGFNVQTIKAVKSFISQYEERGVKVRLRAIGKKGIEYFNFQGKELLSKTIGLSASPSHEKAKEYMDEVAESFKNGETEKVLIVRNGFQNLISQEVRVLDLLPIDASQFKHEDGELSMLEVEPEDDERILNELVERYLDYSLHYALVDSLAAEHSARMQAMDSATRNANEMVNGLTLEYNKARQAAITTELVEIISGMEAIK